MSEHETAEAAANPADPADDTPGGDNLGIDVAVAELDDDELTGVLEALLLVVDTPVAAEALSRPIIRPRRSTNQRLTTVAPSTIATAPEPTPEITPQVAT